MFVFLGGGGGGVFWQGEEVSLQLQHLCICFVCFLIPVLLFDYFLFFSCCGFVLFKSLITLGDLRQAEDNRTEASD